MPIVPDISVIIPNLNSPTLDQTLAALQRQTFDLSRVEVIVVGLDEPGLVSTNDLIRFIPTHRPTSAAYNRNLGMHAARGQILCFTDADCIPAPDWLMGLTSSYTSSQVNVVGGGVEFANDNYWSTCDNFSWFHQFLSTTPAGERPHLPTLNMSLRRSVFEAVGGIDETYPLAAGEDTEWTERMRRRGYRLYFEPKAVVVHLARRTSLVKMLLHSYNYGRFSPKIGRPSTSSQKPGGRRHPYLQAWWVFLLAAPFLATIGTGRVLRSKPAPDVWPAIPGIWLSKLAWCLGAVHTLRERKNYGVPIL